MWIEFSFDWKLIKNREKQKFLFFFINEWNVDINELYNKIWIIIRKWIAAQRETEKIQLIKILNHYFILTLKIFNVVKSN